jgi:hypothetical protein
MLRKGNKESILQKALNYFSRTRKQPKSLLKICLSSVDGNGNMIASGDNCPEEESLVFEVQLSQMDNSDEANEITDNGKTNATEKAELKYYLDEVCSRIH